MQEYILPEFPELSAEVEGLIFSLAQSGLHDAARALFFQVTGWRQATPAEVEQFLMENDF